MNIAELLGGARYPTIDWVESLGKDSKARREWAELSKLRILRVELAYASESCIKLGIAFEVLATAKSWLAEEAYKGVTMAQRDVSGHFLWVVSDGEEEFAIDYGLSDYPDNASYFVDLGPMAKAGEAIWKDRDERD